MVGNMGSQTNINIGGGGGRDMKNEFCTFILMHSDSFSDSLKKICKSVNLAINLSYTLWNGLVYIHFIIIIF